MRALLLMLLGCGSSIPSGAVPMHGTAFCFSAEVKNTRGKRAMGCFDTLALCKQALGTTLVYGRTFAGVTRIGACEQGFAP